MTQGGWKWKRAGRVREEGENEITNLQCSLQRGWRWPTCVSLGAGVLKNKGADLTEAEAGLDVGSGLGVLAAFASGHFRENRIGVVRAALIPIFQ